MVIDSFLVEFIIVAVFIAMVVIMLPLTIDVAVGPRLEVILDIMVNEAMVVVLLGIICAATSASDMPSAPLATAIAFMDLFDPMGIDVMFLLAVTQAVGLTVTSIVIFLGPEVFIAVQLPVIGHEVDIPIVLPFLAMGIVDQAICGPFKGIIWAAILELELFIAVQLPAIGHGVETVCIMGIVLPFLAMAIVDHAIRV